MLFLLVSLQLILPLGLLAWLALAPLRSAAGLWLQVVATGLVLLALAWAGMWLLPPWWAPYLFGALWLASVALAFRRRSPMRFPWPKHWREWAGLSVLVPLGGFAAFVAAEAHAGRTPHGTDVVDLAFPLRGGPYLVLSGGSTRAINAHMVTLVPADERTAAYRGQSYAVDIVKVGAFGLRARGLRPRDPAAYRTFGEPLYAPCGGVVLQTENDLPDLPVPETDRDHLPGNHVLIDCGSAVVLMAHMREGSVTVGAGQSVRVGAHVGAVGNSGNTDEPHLHIHAQQPGTADALLSGAPLQVRIGGRFLVRNDRFHVPE